MPGQPDAGEKPCESEGDDERDRNPDREDERIGDCGKRLGARKDVVPAGEAEAKRRAQRRNVEARRDDIEHRREGERADGEDEGATEEPASKMRSKRKGKQRILRDRTRMRVLGQAAPALARLRNRAAFPPHSAASWSLVSPISSNIRADACWPA